MTDYNLVDDPNAYGSKKQVWHEAFVAYMVDTVRHPVYADMPDAVKEDGKIQWEAPSNRKSGKYKYTYHNRRLWWLTKAESIGIGESQDQWISTVAKRIHPTGEKPCKRCGQVMKIAYVYPNANLRARIAREFGASYVPDPLEAIGDIVCRVADQFGEERLGAFRTLLATSASTPPPNLKGKDAWLSWLDSEYSPSEPSLLSPGAMSNAPDRFDGFHSFNLCCRKAADAGRNSSNMRMYTTDRRVFEFWSDGDWIAADRMMGLIAARFRGEPCADGGSGCPSADHIGPLSLGFAHRPHFRLLSRSANSAKNNRMTPQDICDLIAAESENETVVSWYAARLWQLRKRDAGTDQLAVRLSRQLRDNQRVAMHVLFVILEGGHHAFLASLLDLQYADYSVDFTGLSVANFVPQYSAIVHNTRGTIYAREQQSRRMRIGFDALRVYGAKRGRHDAIVSRLMSVRADAHLRRALGALDGAEAQVVSLNREIAMALAAVDAKSGELLLRELAPRIVNTSDNAAFVAAKRELTAAMDEVGQLLASMWEHERYVRPSLDCD